MGLWVRKHVFGVYDQVRLKPACSTSETIHNIETVSSWWSHYVFQKANHKGTDQTAQMPRLVCAFVIVMQVRFSPDEAHKNNL